MADRVRGEAGKAVKNPLLSGAGVAFPFETFPGPSLLVPVARESPIAALEDEGEVDTFVGQEAPVTEEVKFAANPPQERPASATQRYTGLFSSFFGATQSQEDLPAQTRAENKPPASQSSVCSTPRSSSPFVHVPSVLSYSPALLVPEDKPAEDKSSKLLTAAAVENLPTLVPSYIPEGQSTPSATLSSVSLVSPPSETVTARPPTLYFSNPSTTTATSSLPPPPTGQTLPPPPSRQTNPLQANVYRQVAKEPKTSSQQPPVRHFIPVALTQELPRSETADFLNPAATSLGTASSSSSNDSIIADLQSRFNAANVSADPTLSDPTVSPLQDSSKVAEEKGVVEKNNVPQSFFTPSFAELASDQFQGSSQALFDSAEHQHSCQAEDQDDFRDSFGVIGQPLHHPNFPTQSNNEAQKTHSYGVPVQGFGQLPSSGATSNFEEKGEYKPSAAQEEATQDKLYISGQQPTPKDPVTPQHSREPGRNEAEKISEREESIEKTFYGQSSDPQQELTSGSQTFSGGTFYDQPNFSNEAVASYSSSPGSRNQSIPAYGFSSDHLKEEKIRKQTLSYDSVPDSLRQENKKDQHFPGSRTVGEDSKEASPAPIYSTGSAAEQPQTGATAQEPSSAFSVVQQPSSQLTAQAAAPGAYFDQLSSYQQPSSAKDFPSFPSIGPLSSAPVPSYQSSVPAQPPVRVSPPGKGAPPPSTGATKYRLGNQRRPVYAPVPGLSSGIVPEAATGQPPSSSTAPTQFFTPSFAPIPQNPPASVSTNLPTSSNSFTPQIPPITSASQPFVPSSIPEPQSPPSSFFTPSAPPSLHNSSDHQQGGQSPASFFSLFASAPSRGVTESSAPPALSHQTSPPASSLFKPIPTSVPSPTSSNSSLVDPSLLVNPVSIFEPPPSQPSNPSTLFDPSPAQPPKPLTLFDPSSFQTSNPSPSQPSNSSTLFDPSPSQVPKPTTLFDPSQPPHPSTPFDPSQPPQPSTLFCPSPSQPSKPSTLFDPSPSQPPNPSTLFTTSPSKPPNPSTFFDCTPSQPLNPPTLFDPTSSQSPNPSTLFDPSPQSHYPFGSSPSHPNNPSSPFDPTFINSPISQPSSGVIHLASSGPSEALFFNPPVPPTGMATSPTDPSTLNTVDLSTPSPPRRSPSPSVVPQRLLNLGQSGIIYRPPYHHWFWNNDSDEKESWQPFSMTDSLELEQAFSSASLTMDTTVPTDGGRYDVAVVARRREAVYWRERPRDVRRCSWFHRCTTETRFRPYDENTAFLLEEEYKAAVTSATWNRRVQLNDGEHVVLYGPSSMAHFLPAMPVPDGWDAATDLANQSQARPRIVKRGVEDFEIEDGESPVVDHLLFVVHGIGAICDLKFRTIEEAVNDFRSVSHQLVKTHYRTAVEQGDVNRIEILPVSWHHNLHGETGVDDKLQKITLKSIPKLRHFTNDTLLDILFYTSPVYCQNIMQQVGQELNKLYDLFLRRNPTFQGNVSVAGHSLGSLILFDMLCHQKRATPSDADDSSSPQAAAGEGASRDRDRTVTRTGSYVTGTAGTGQPYITYPQLAFHPNSFFAMGSPIGMFVTVRGIDCLGLDFRLPTCPGFFNIFHPFDPVAYRIEALINPDLADKRPVLIPHHKGRKRMHLELRETMARVGADLKQRVIDSVKATWNTVYQLTMFGRGEDVLHHEVDAAIASQLEGRVRTESSCEEDGQTATGFNVGQVNQGRRVDYVLQEAPLESFNEYVSAITSHVCYWDSDDTMLFILKDVYSNMGVAADSPASIAAAAEEQAASSSGHQSPPTPPSPTSFVPPRPFGPVGMDPTAPISSTSPVQPPPMGGFVRK